MQCKEARSLCRRRTELYDDEEATKLTQQGVFCRGSPK